MSYEDFFRPPGDVRDPNFFDEGPRIPGNKQGTVSDLARSGSIDTTAVNPYRQGVEITRLKYFDAGLVKIHAGEPGHVLRKNRFGMDKNFRTDPTFQELDYFNPVTFLRAQELGSPLFDKIFTFPIITGDNDQSENFVLDGIIEPFPIREVASFFSIEAPFQSRTVKAALMGGNSDTTTASDQVLTVDYFEPEKQQIAYLDLVDLIGPSGSAPQPLNGFFEFNKSTRRPFDDARLPRNIPISTTYDSTMIAALSVLNGSTDNYVSFKQKSNAAGSYYDNTPAGTDSIAFGGMTH